VGKVKVELSGVLRTQVGTYSTTTRAGLTARETATMLGIPATQDIMVIVNGRVTELNYVLKAGDQLKLIPPINGGGK
jgi:molybdopterin converting factor small subunit